MPSKRPEITVFTAIKLQGCRGGSRSRRPYGDECRAPLIFPQLTMFSVCCSLWVYTFLFFMAVKTFIPVQGQCRKACMQTGTVHVATRAAGSLEVKVHVANVGTLRRRALKWLPRRDGPMNTKGVIRLTDMQGHSGGRGSLGLTWRWGQERVHTASFECISTPEFPLPISSQVTLLSPLPPHGAFVFLSGPARARSSYLPHRRVELKDSDSPIVWNMFADEQIFH